VLIRCEKCNTLYELDEKLLPPSGAPVQCSKCQFVFKAYPGPREEPAPASEETEAKAEETAAREVLPPTPPEGGDGGDGGAAVNEPPPVSSADASNASLPGKRAAVTAQPDAGSAKGQAPIAKRPGPRGNALPGPDEPQFTADGRPIRKVPFPTEEPASPMGPRPSLGRVPGPSEVSSKQRRWVLVLVPLVLALVLAAAFVAWRMLGRRSDASSVHRRAEGHSLLLPADRAGLAREGLASSGDSWVIDTVTAHRT